MAEEQEMFAAADKYQLGMGSWSEKLAPLFIQFLGTIREGDHVLDVGCGTGSLTFMIGDTTKASKIVGIDPSQGFIEYARAKNSDSRVSFDVGDSQQLPYDDSSFDKCVSSLVLNFIPDVHKGLKEARRVTKVGGLVAACNWDSAGGMEFFSHFWDAAVALNPEAERLHVKHRPYTTAEELSKLWIAGGLEKVETTALVIPLEFNSFDDLWILHLNWQGPAGPYTRSLSEDQQAALRKQLGSNILGSRPDEPFFLHAKSWAVRGTVPTK